MAVNYIKSYITQNPYFCDKRYLSGKDFIGFFLHSVGCSQPDPMVFIRGWNKPTYDRAGVNGFIGGNDVHIIAPCLETPGTVKRMPHAGSPANNHYIGFEMCEPKWIKYVTGGTFTVADGRMADTKAFVTATYNSAVDLFARLCLFHNKNPLQDKVILSHREGALLGIATNHGDPEHLWKGLKMGYTMDTFRQAVATRMKQELPTLVLTDNTDLSSLFPNDDSYNPFAAEITNLPGMDKVAYMATIDRNTTKVDYTKLKDLGVVGVCIEAGYLFDESHKKVDYNSPKFREQVAKAREANMAVALFATTRARSVEEAKQELSYLSLCARTAAPELGFWLKLKLNNSVLVNDAILKTYEHELTRVGLKDRIGLYVKKSDLKLITWAVQSNSWWLWIDSHLSSVSSMSELLTPHVFALDEVT
jgi:DNA-binding transcriptional regulator YhcF (GntR family)